MRLPEQNQVSYFVVCLTGAESGDNNLELAEESAEIANMVVSDTTADNSNNNSASSSSNCISGGSGAVPTAIASTVPLPRVCRSWFWGEKEHFVPQNFVFPQ